MTEFDIYVENADSGKYFTGYDFEASLHYIMTAITMIMLVTAVLAICFLVAEYDVVFFVLGFISAALAVIALTCENSF